MEFHEVANIFPMMSDTEFKSLKDDIQAYGLREAIWTYQDKIVDGRNRYNACKALEIKPEFREWDGVGSLASFVVSLNLHRRHLNESQRAMVAAKLANLESSKHATSIDVAVSQPDAAKMLNVGVASVQRAKQVLKKATPETIAAVESGNLPVSVATQHIAAVSKYPELASPLIPQNIAITVAKNLDAMPDDERAEKRSKFIAGDTNTRAVLAGKPPMPPPIPKLKTSASDNWQKSIATLRTYFASIRTHGGIESLTTSWTDAQKDNYFQTLTDFRAELNSIITAMEADLYAIK